MLRLLLIKFFIFFSIYIFSQDTLFYDNEWNLINNLNNASYFKLFKLENDSTGRGEELIYFSNGNNYEEIHYSNFKEKVLDGVYKKWYENNQLRKEIEYKNDKFDGKLITYWDNGSIKRFDNYIEDSLLNGKCYNESGIEVDYYNYYISPEFEGGIEGIQRYTTKKLRYPKKLRKQGLEGKVIVSFVVNKDGSISDVEINKGSIEEFNVAALTFVKNMKRWIPGKIDGEYSRFRFRLPVSFKLQ